MVQPIKIIESDWREDWLRLQQRWRATSMVWKDTVGEKFEREFWDPLEIHVKVTLKELQSLSDVIAKAHTDIDRT